MALNEDEYCKGDQPRPPPRPPADCEADERADKRYQPEKHKAEANDLYSLCYSMQSRELPDERSRRLVEISNAHPATWAIRGRRPQWLSDAFVGEFLDPYVDNTNLQGGQTGIILKEYCSVFGDAVRNFAADMGEPDEFSAIATEVCEKLLYAGTIARQASSMLKSRQTTYGSAGSTVPVLDTHAFDKFVADRSAQGEEAI